MKKNTFRLVPFLVLPLLVSCNQTTDEHITEPVYEVLDTATPPAEEKPVQNVAAPASFVLTDTNEYVQILNETSYHGDEVAEDLDQQSWIGLYVNKPHYFLEETTIQAERVHDPIVDEAEHIKTGWDISSSHPDENIILIKGMQAETGEVIHCRLDLHEILPGDTVKFTLEGKSFELFASGDNIDLGGYSTAENYKLFLHGEKNGEPITQLLVAQENFDDSMIRVIFAGDLDRDHFPDFLIDNADHYNVGLPTLYLSSQADNTRFVEIVGWQMSVGC